MGIEGAGEKEREKEEEKEEEKIEAEERKALSSSSSPTPSPSSGSVSRAATSAKYPSVPLPSSPPSPLPGQQISSPAPSPAANQVQSPLPQMHAQQMPAPSSSSPVAERATRSRRKFSVSPPPAVPVSSPSSVSVADAALAQTPSSFTPQRKQTQAPKGNFESIADEITRAHFQDQNKWGVVGGKRESGKKNFTVEKKGSNKKYSACVEKDADGNCVFKASKFDKKDEKAALRELFRIAVNGAEPGSRFDLGHVSNPRKKEMMQGILEKEIKRAKAENPAKFSNDADYYIVSRAKTVVRPGQ